MALRESGSGINSFAPGGDCSPLVLHHLEDNFKDTLCLARVISAHSVAFKNHLEQHGWNDSGSNGVNAS